MMFGSSDSSLSSTATYAGNDLDDSDSSMSSPSTTLAARNLSTNITEDELKKTFNEYGEVVSAAVLRGSIGQPQTGRVQFKRRADAEKAFISMDGVRKIDGELVQLMFAPSPARRQQRTSAEKDVPPGRKDSYPRCEPTSSLRKRSPEGYSQPQTRIVSSHSFSHSDRTSPRGRAQSPSRGKSPNSPSRHRSRSPVWLPSPARSNLPPRREYHGRPSSSSSGSATSRKVNVDRGREQRSPYSSSGSDRGKEQHSSRHRRSPSSSSESATPRKEALRSVRSPKRGGR